MGMDFLAIIDHNRTAKEVLQLPQIIENSKKLKRIFCEFHSYEIEKLAPCVWDCAYPMTEENLEVIWENLENKTEIDVGENINIDAEIETYFGSIYVNRKTINISLFPEHKYGNLRCLEVSEYIFKINRIIATLLGTDRIVYCCDSYYYPELIETKSMEGLNNDGIIKYGNKLFGVPPTEINEAIENLYFIDDFSMKLNELDPMKKVWSRATYEQQKKEKGEKPYKWLDN